MINFLTDLTSLSCKQFARHVATSRTSQEGIYWHLQFLTHWVICEFCRRYWKELKTIGRVHKKNATLSRAVRDLPAIKDRLRRHLKDL